MTDADPEPSAQDRGVRLLDRLDGRSIAPNAWTSAWLLVAFTAAAAVRAGYVVPGMLDLARFGAPPAYDSLLPWGLFFAATCVGVALGSLSCATLGAPLTGTLAAAPLAIAIPAQAAVVLLVVGPGGGNWISFTLPFVGFWFVLFSASAALGIAAWASLAGHHTGRRSVPALPFAVAASVAVFLPTLARADPDYPLGALVLGLVTAPMAVVGFALWLAYGAANEKEAPAARAPSPRRIGVTVLVWLGSTVCWVALWTWLPAYDYAVSRVTDEMASGTLPGFVAAAAGAVWIVAAWVRPSVSSLRAAGAAFLLLAGAVALTITPWWHTTPVVLANIALYSAGSILLLGAVVRRTAEDLPARTVPLALGPWLLVLALHDTRLADLVGSERAWVVQRLPDAPIALACAAWGALLIGASWTVDRWPPDEGVQ